MIRLGRFEFPQRGETPWDAAIRVDAEVGYPSGTVRHYLALTGSWSGAFTTWGLEHNRVNVYSISSWDDHKNPIPWRDVAAGLWDSHITSSANDLLAAIIATGSTARCYVGWHHEPENEEDGKISGDITGTCGTRAECKAAGERFCSIVSGILGNYARVGQTLMAGSYRSGRYVEWLPDNAWWCGIDGYSHGTFNPDTGVGRETFETIFPPSHLAATATGRRLVIQEMGVAEVPTDPTFKARFFADAQDTIKGWGECRIVEYSNVTAKLPYLLDTSDASLAAFRTWAADLTYRGDWT